jgi:hypothetical protein
MNPYGAVLDDDCARPRAPHERILGYDFTVRSHQRLDDLESAAADWNGDAIDAQLARHEIDRPLAGLNDVLFGLAHVNVLFQEYFGSSLLIGLQASIAKQSLILVASRSSRTRHGFFGSKRANFLAIVRITNSSAAPDSTKRASSNAIWSSGPKCRFVF